MLVAAAGQVTCVTHGPQLLSMSALVLHLASSPWLAPWRWELLLLLVFLAVTILPCFVCPRCHSCLSCCICISLMSCWTHLVWRVDSSLPSRCLHTFERNDHRCGTSALLTNTVRPFYVFYDHNNDDSNNNDHVYSAPPPPPTPLSFSSDPFTENMMGGRHEFVCMECVCAETKH